MFAHKCTELFPVGNAMTVTLLIALFGTVVTSLLVALIPVGQRITVEVERLAHREEGTARFDGFDSFLAEVLTVGRWHWAIAGFDTSYDYARTLVLLAISDWVKALAAKQVDSAQRLVDLQQQLGMPLIEVWIAALLGGFTMEQRGSFYQTQEVWVSRCK